MQRIGSALFLFIPAILLIFMFPQKISAGRSCSLTVHSYVSQCGDENDGTYADGQNVPDDASPLSGADYSLWKVGDVTTQNLDGTVTICACHINDELYIIENAYRAEIEAFFDYISGNREAALYDFKKDQKILELIDRIEGV